MNQQTLAPVHHEVTVPLPIERAFSVFTESFDTWWPRTHKIGTAELAEAVLESRTGGRWYERGADGSECDWGKVIAYEPPRRLVITWQIDSNWQYDPDPAHGSEVEVLFTEEGGQTRVELEHRHIERHGAAADELRKAVGSTGGWPGLLDGYAKAAAAA
jgi:uncharacterized protein YndB with AHSA1/START domain